MSPAPTLVLLETYNLTNLSEELALGVVDFLCCFSGFNPLIYYIFFSSSFGWDLLISLQFHNGEPDHTLETFLLEPISSPQASPLRSPHTGCGKGPFLFT